MPFPGQETPRGPVPAPPTLSHNICKFRNIPGLTRSTSCFSFLLTIPVTPVSPSHVLYPPPGQSSRRPNGHSRSLTVGNLISYPAPQSPGTRTSPRGFCPIALLLLLPIMRSLLFSLLLLPPFVLASLLNSLADDIYAFPKYGVTFLNGLPLLNETAERWLREGLRGGEAEFLDHPTQWREPSPFKHIDAGEGTAVGLLMSSVVAHALPTRSRPPSNLTQIILLR